MRKTEKIKDTHIDNLRTAIKDCNDTIAFVKSRPWKVGMTITPELYEENTKFAIATCNELKRNLRSQIRKRLKEERQKNKIG